MAEYYRISRFLHVEDEAGSVSLGGEWKRDDAGFDFTHDTETVETGLYGEREKRTIQEQTIGTTPVALDVGDVIAEVGIRVVCIVNKSNTQRVTIYSDNGSTVLDYIPKGEARIFEPKGQYVPYLKSQTGSVTVQHLAVAMPVP